MVAPTTLVTALLYWFGFEFMEAQAAPFGLGTGTLGFSTTDYLVRGVEAGIVPLIVLFLLVLAAVAVYVVGRGLAARQGRTPAFRWVVWGSIVLGVGIAAAGVRGVFVALPRPLDHYLLPPACLASGPLLAALGISRVNPRWLPSRPARIGAVAVGGLVVVSMFWAASLYADALGRGEAEALGGDIGGLTRTTLYSTRPLGIAPETAVAEQLPGGEDGGYAYRYSGLRLLIRSDEKYFLLPDAWSPSSGTVLVISEGPDVRLEFAPAGG